MMCSKSDGGWGARYAVLLAAVVWLVPPLHAAISCHVPNSTAPVAVDDHLDWPAAAIVIPVLQNDYDPDGQALRITAVGDSPGGTISISQDQKSLVFTPAANQRTAQFNYTIADASGESCNTPGWVYVRDPAPTVSFTSSCIAYDCTFRATPSTLEAWRDYTWRFKCPPGASGCTERVVTAWRGHSYRHSFPAAGAWTVELEANYHTGKIARQSRALQVQALNPYIRFVQVDAGRNDLCLSVKITETNAHDTFTTQYEMRWGDGTSTPFAHIAGGPIVERTLDHCYADAGVYDVRSWLRTKEGEEASYTQNLEVVNAPPEVSLSVSQDANRVTPAVTAVDDGGGARRSTGIARYELDFGNGSTRVGRLDTDPYTYQTPGTYQITMKVTDDGGLTATAVREVTIANRPPAGKLWASCIDLQCKFEVQDLWDDLGVQSYSWTVPGAGTVVTREPVYTHVFSAAGRYEVSVGVSDGELTTTSRKLLEVRAPASRQELVLFTIPPCRAYDSGADLLTHATIRAVSLASCVPADAKVVELNATIVGATQNGGLRMWSPADPAEPYPFLSFVAGVVRANNAAVAVSNRTVNAKITTVPSGGTARLIVDVVGYYTANRAAVAPEAGPLELLGVTPYRDYDSREAGGEKLSAAVPGQLFLAAQPRAATAAFSNLTVIDSTGAGNLKAHAAGTAAPAATTLNFPVGGSVANGALARVSTAQETTLTYSSPTAGATAHYTADVFGHFVPATASGARFEQLKPCRVLDTRDPAYGAGRVAGGNYLELRIPGNCGVPEAVWWRDGALRLNVTVVNPSVAGELKIDDGQEPFTETSVLAYAAGVTASNGLVLPMTNALPVLWSSAETDVLIDVVGYYWAPPAFLSASNGLTLLYEMPYGTATASTRTTWSYGDGTTGGEAIEDRRCKTYAFAGSYTVRVSTWDVRWPQVVSTQSRVVSVANRAPVAQFSLTQDRKAVTVDARGSRDEPPVGEVIQALAENCDQLRTDADLTYSWSFGGAATGAGSVAAHTYTRPGSYNVTLTVTDRAGVASTTSRTVVVPNDPPVAQLSFNCSGLACDFSAAESTDDGGITAYDWNFGGTAVTTTTPARTYTFPAAGSYAVTLVARDGALASTAARAVVQVTSTAAGPTLSFFPVTPCRVFDSRTSSPLVNRAVASIPVTAAAGVSRCGIPAAAQAAAVNVLVFQPATAGTVLAWNGSSPVPPVQTAVFPGGGVSRASNAVVQISTSGTIAVRPDLSGTTASTHAILDVFGYYAPSTHVPAASARGPYRYGAVRPCRTFDSTREHPLSNGEVRFLQVDRETCGIPSGALAVASNLTIINSTAFGHATLFSSAAQTPDASTINFGAATNLANGSPVELGGRAQDDLALSYVTFSPSTADAIVDVSGYYSASALLSYQAVRPCRLLDTRDSSYGRGRIPAGAAATLQVQGTCGVPRGARAAALHVTVLGADGRGNLRMDRSDRPQIATSILNFNSGEDVSNAAIVELSALQRDVVVTPTMFGGTGLHLVVDVVGFFRE